MRGFTPILFATAEQDLLKSLPFLERVDTQLFYNNYTETKIDQILFKDRINSRQLYELKAFRHFRFLESPAHHPLGSLVYAIGAEAVLVHHKFIIGGIYGTALLIYYKSNLLSPGIWYFLLNTPLLLAGWIFLSRRFFFYSLYGVCTLTFFAQFLTLNFAIHDQLYAAVAGGAICGVGAGITLRSRGSGGGLDIVAIILNQKYNFGVGKSYMLYNVALFTFVFSQYQPDLVIASIILAFISSITLEHMLAMFNQRLIVSIS